MKHLLYASMLLGCLALSSCAKESLSPELFENHRAEETHVVKLSLGANFRAFDKEALSDIADAGFRALERQELQFEVTDGKGKWMLDDQGKPTTIPSKRAHLDKDDLQDKAANLKFFVQVRKTSDKSLVGSLYKAWEYKSRNTTDWSLNGDDIPLTGVTPGTDALQVRVVVGGDLDAEAKKIVIGKPEYQELDLSKETKVSLPVPFASDWVDLNYDAASSLYTTVGDAKITLKPLGTLLVTTVRSTLKDKTASLTGIRYVSNALAFQGEFTLDGSDAISFKAVGGRPYTTEVTQDTFYEIVYNFKEGTLTPTAAPNDKVFVSWGLPTGKPKGITWQTNNGPWQRGDLEPMISQPQTHVYAEGVTAQSVTNFKIAPVMGTNYNFNHGKSVAINCELYDTPKQILGYLAKYTVNESGTGFDNSHDVDKISLVNWKVAKDFLKGKELTGPDGQKAIYKMGSEAMAVYTANYFSAVWSANNAGLYFRLLDQKDSTKGALVARSRQMIYNKGTDEKPNIDEAMLYLMQVYIPKRNPKASYMIIGRDFSKNRSFSKDQSIIRIESTQPNGPGKYPVGSTTMTSVALGKYFIGTAYSPIYKNKAAYDEDLWSDPVFLKGRVQRKMPASGHYAYSSWNPNNPTEVADVDNLRPANTTRDEVGQVPIYWFWSNWVDYIGTSRMMKRLRGGQNPTWNGAQWLSDPTVFDDQAANNVLFFPDNAGGTLRSVNRDAKYMWQALWPIANKYQGDNAD